VTELRAKGLVPEDWWKAYEDLVEEVGASKPKAAAKKRKPARKTSKKPTRKKKTKPKATQ
jgi:hypothetical protein